MTGEVVAITRLREGGKREVRIISDAVDRFLVTLLRRAAHHGILDSSQSAAGLMRRSCVNIEKPTRSRDSRARTGTE